MHRLLRAALALALLGAVATATWPVDRAVAQAETITLCHATGSAQNPFVVITVAESAVPAHLAHGDTIAASPEQSPEDCEFDEQG